jgi:hypothetical protein
MDNAPPSTRPSADLGHVFVAGFGGARQIIRLIPPIRIPEEPAAPLVSSYRLEVLTREGRCPEG